MQRTVSAISLATLALCACSGGGGGAGNVTLDSKSDVLRELGNSVGVVGELTGLQLGSSGVSASSLSAKSASTTGSGAAVAPRTAQIENCDSGSVSHEDATNVSRIFTLFGSTPQNVSTTRLIYSNCQHTDTGSTPNLRNTINGVSEIGTSDLTSDGSLYAYTRYGNGDTPIDYRHEQLSFTQTSYSELNRYLGTLEVKVGSDGLTSTRAAYSNSYSDSTGYRADMRYGSDGTALQIDHDASNTQLSINGRYNYSSSICSGGTVDVTTPSTLSLDAAGHPVGGTLQITNGSQTATLNFQPDGSASLLLNGVTQTLSSSELQTAIGAPPC